MSLKRTGFLSVLALGATGGCAKYTTMESLPIDCSVENAYDFDATPVDLTVSYNAWDMTPGSSSTLAVVTIPGGALCSTPTALEFTVSHDNDWGALAGFYSFGSNGQNYRDESAFEGVSFWARAPGPTNKSFTLALDDANTAGGRGDAGVNCKDYGLDGGTVNNPTGGYIDPLTGMPVSGGTTAAPPPDACGNSYSAAFAITTEWRFYVTPFTRFHQTATPNRVPNPALPETGTVPGSGLLTDRLMNMIFRLPKEAQTDLWIGKLNFYRKKASGTPGDGGADAP
jgi:hypothetical protein